MLRSSMSSGEIFEPKTVESAFAVRGASTFAHMFGLDLDTNEFVWLNVIRDSSQHVAGMSANGYLELYFNSVNVMSLADTFAMMATEVVDDPALADTVLADGEVTCAEGAEQIHSYDFEKITALLG